MIDLVREIRRHVSSDVKPTIKLANPDLLYELRSIYHSGSDIVVNALIKELYFKAGSEWTLEPEEQPLENKHLTTKVYRGQVQVIEVAPEKSSEALKEGASTTKKVKMYRGHPVVE